MHMNTWVSFRMLHFAAFGDGFGLLPFLPSRTYVVLIRDEIVAQFRHILGTFWHLAIFRVRQSGRKKLQG